MISLLQDAASYAVWEDGVLIYADEWVKAEPKPQIPAEVWNDRPINGDTCMAAMRAMCEGNAR